MTIWYSKSGSFLSVLLLFLLCDQLLLCQNKSYGEVSILNDMYEELYFLQSYFQVFELERDKVVA